MRSPRLKIYDDKGNGYSMKNFKATVKEETLKDLIPQALIVKQKLLTSSQIKKFILDDQLHRVDFKGQIYFNKLEVAKCLNAKGMSLNLS